MDLFYNRLIMVIILLLLLGCQSIISNNENPSDDENIELIAFVVDYDNEESEISVYLELEDTDYIIDSIHALIINPDTEQNVATFQLLESNINSNLFLYQGIVSFISDDVYIYNISIKLSYYYCDDLNYNNQESCEEANYIWHYETLDFFTTSFTTPIAPEIMPLDSLEWSWQLDEEEWTFLPVDIEILNLNGLDNIESVKYEIKRALNGCDGDCLDGTDECNEPITDDSYQSDETWLLNYVSSYNDNHLYHVNIPMRPLNGSELLDDDGNIVFEESDCGRTGVVFFKFIVTDKDNLSDEISDIILEIE